MLEDDPVFGAFIANYPIKRARLLIPAVGVCGLAALALNLTVAPMSAEWGPLLATVLLAVVTLAAGWQVLHLWNREVVLYENGFTYREGARTVFFLYGEVRSIRQRAEQLVYFGGLIRRAVYRFTIITLRGERMVLGNRYQRIGDLCERLEMRVNAVLMPFMSDRLAKGEQVAFSDSLRLSADGLHASGRHLPWGQFGAYQVAGGQLSLKMRSGEVWFSLPLAETDNITVLLRLLHQHIPA